jgi:regulatory protein
VEPQSSADKLATVTYLFGETAPAGRVPAEPGPAGRVPAEPVYRDQPATDSDTKAHKTSLNALTRRGMSVAEMTALLESRDFEEGQIEDEIERLHLVGLLDDAALAETLVRTLQERKGLGKYAIEAELRRREIDPCIILEALQVIDSDDELNRAIEVAEKRAGQLSSYDAATAKRRLYAYMQRRGYSGKVLAQAVDAALTPMQSKGPRFR